MNTLNRSVTIDKPIDAVYRHWTLFERYPDVVDTIETVHQDGPQRVDWTLKFRGVQQTWRSVIVEQHPNRLIAFSTFEGDFELEGRIEFEELAPGRTRVHVQLQFEPDGVAVRWATMTGLDAHLLESGLGQLSDWITNDTQLRDGWLGVIDDGNLVNDDIVMDDARELVGAGSPRSS